MLWRQASSEQANAQSRRQVSREMLLVHWQAWACLSIVTLECTSPAKRFPPKSVNEKKMFIDPITDLCFNQWQGCHARPQVSKKMPRVGLKWVGRCYLLLTCLSSATLECTSPAKRFPLKTTNLNSTSTRKTRTNKFTHGLITTRKKYIFSHFSETPANERFISV